MSQSLSRNASSRATLAELQTTAPVILPSLLQCDFSRLGEEIHAVSAAGAQALHLDVMDGHFVPNLSYGPLIVDAVRRVTDLPLDAHLMIADPARYAESFIQAGADSVTIHIEAVKDPLPVLRQIRAAGAQVGLALNPPTPVEAVLPYLEECDMVLVMSVMPGFGGQAFDDRALEKLYRLRELVGPGFPLEVDGGVNQKTITKCAQAGADLFVVGSAIFAGQDYAHEIAELNRLARSV